MLLIFWQFVLCTLGQNRLTWKNHRTFRQCFKNCFCLKCSKWDFECSTKRKMKKNKMINLFFSFKQALKRILIWFLKISHSIRCNKLEAIENELKLILIIWWNFHWQKYSSITNRFYCHNDRRWVFFYNKNLVFNVFS